MPLTTMSHLHKYNVQGYAATNLSHSQYYLSMLIACFPPQKLKIKKFLLFVVTNCNPYKVEKIPPVIKFIYCNSMSRWTAQQGCTAQTFADYPAVV